MGVWQRVRDAATVLTYPLSFDDFAGLVDPLASSKQLRGVVTRVQAETADSVTVWLRPGRGWASHQAGQWVRVGVEIDGVRHWRSYSVVTAAGEPPAVTVTATGLVSEQIVRRTRVGDVWYLQVPQGDFTLPDRARPLLMLTAGNGITPVMSMLRTLTARRTDADVVLLHSARHEADVLFADELDALVAAHPGLRSVVRITSRDGRLDLSGTAELDALVPDWRTRAAYACGPAELVADAEALWARAGISDALTLERFTPPAAAVTDGTGGRVTFTVSDRDVDVPEGTSVLEAAEQAGVLLPSGCRMGICRSCLVPLAAGRLRHLTTGEVLGDEGELVQTCVTAPAGDVRLDC